MSLNEIGEGGTGVGFLNDYESHQVWIFYVVCAAGRPKLKEQRPCV